MKTGDIVLIPFPFSELTNIKIRPACVIGTTNDKYKDLIVSAISSVVPESLNPNEILLNPTSLNKLKVSSILKVDRIVTLKSQDKIADLGCLSETEKLNFIQLFRNIANEK